MNELHISTPPARRLADAYRTLSGQGRIFVCRLLLGVRPRDTGSGRHHNDHRRRNPVRNRNRIRPFYSPTGETYRNNNIVAKTIKAVKGACPKNNKN